MTNAIFPVQPPKPRISLLADGALLDTGYVDIVFDSWDEALVHAGRICRDYKSRVLAYLDPPSFCDQCAGPYLANDGESNRWL